jgi:Glyoxalase/Bleomycin resistance protein/Dioxygenase superfamily
VCHDALTFCKAIERSTVMITHVKFVSIPTHDQDRSLAFYTEKVGFKLVTDQPFDQKQR